MDISRPLAVLAALALMSPISQSASPDWNLITLDPGHFHAALVQKEAIPGISDLVYVYAPLGPDVTAHLNRIAQFNLRKENPTGWKSTIYAGPDYFEKMLKERRGKLVVLSGRNLGKIDRIQAISAAGMHVLADKPWVIEPEDLPKLDSALALARKRGVAVYDGMTQRFEISCILQKALVNDPEMFGKPVQGTVDEPSVYVESVHHILKQVAGVPNLRPAWFFDIRQQGEGLADVGTHLVDLVQWTLASEQHLEPAADIKVLGAKRWPTVVSKAEFRRVTGEREFPEYLQSSIKDDRLEYFCNNRVDYALRGTHVRLDVKWEFEAEAGAADTEIASYRGTKARVEVRQGKSEGFRPELFIVPAPGMQSEVLGALRARLKTLEREYPGLGLVDQGERLWVTIPDTHRTGHEAHFSLLLKTFLKYAHDPASVPSWEDAFMRAKYYVTTKGIALAR